MAKGWLLVWSCPHCGEDVVVPELMETPGAAESALVEVAGRLPPRTDPRVLSLDDALARGIIGDEDLAHLGLSDLEEVA